MTIAKFNVMYDTYIFFHFHIRPYHRIGQSQHSFTIFLNRVGFVTLILHVSFQEHQTSGSEEEDFEGFCHIWAWRQSLLCDFDHI